MNKAKHGKGFTLVELLVVIAIIGILSSIILAALSTATSRARDAKRKMEVSQFGRLLSLSCFVPQAGGGDYDLSVLYSELINKYPQYANQVPQIPTDPKKGTPAESYYRYVVTADGSKCALYANLENSSEKVTLTNLTIPTPGGGTGVLKTNAAGWNGTDRYFEVSN